MSEREADLQCFLQRAAQTPFIYGQCDCCLFVADWILTRRGVDVAAFFRGGYENELEADVLIAAEGGLKLLAERYLSQIGLEAIQNPNPGDIGIVSTSLGETLAIKTANSKWACKSTRGIIVTSFQTLFAWEL